MLRLSQGVQVSPVVKLRLFGNMGETQNITDTCHYYKRSVQHMESK